jgi:site-specific DNA-methyltransferase (adenine-specific)/modification methylase
VNRVLEGDCLERLNEVPDASVHLVLCDLPYGTTRNPWDRVIPLTPLWEAYRRILAPNGAIVLSAQGPFTAKLMMSNEEWFRYKIVWIKSKATNFLNAKRQPLRRHEDILVFYPRPPTYNPQMSSGIPYDKGVRKNQLTGSYGAFEPVSIKSEGGRYPTDLIYFKTAESEGKVWHPTQKPVALGRYLIRTFTHPGQVVLDNACGSGSFLVAAIQEGRNVLGIERNLATAQFQKTDIHLIDVCEQRMQDAWQGLTPKTRRHLTASGLFRTTA